MSFTNELLRPNRAYGMEGCKSAFTSRVAHMNLMLPYHKTRPNMCSGSVGKGHRTETLVRCDPYSNYVPEEQGLI